MKIQVLEEPELEFGSGRHIDIRFGIMNHGPLDLFEDGKPRHVKLGLVGAPLGVEGVVDWLDRCRGEVAAKESRQPNLFPRFPGFREDTAFRSSLLLDRKWHRTIPASMFARIPSAANTNVAVADAVTAYGEQIKDLVDSASIDLVVCVVPPELAELLDPANRRVPPTEPVLDFHDALKALCIRHSKPLQLVLHGTFDSSQRRSLKIRPEQQRTLQDDATRAWNFHTALYYKAHGRPWRIQRDPHRLTTCYVGVSFYKSVHDDALNTSIAQVFDERGDGMVVKGAPAHVTKKDRTPHLNEDDAARLLGSALQRYRDVHRTSPARLVMHKTSTYSPAELAGFKAALTDERISSGDFVSVSLGETLKLFRHGRYPPLRGTFLQLDDVHHALYTRGSVPFYSTYPGGYVPRPLLFRCEAVDETPRFIAEEILALTKMNWNMTQFDGGQPITIEAARNVGRMLRYLSANDPIAQDYAHYM